MAHDSTHAGGPIVCYACLREAAAPQLTSRPAPLDERHIDAIARRVVELLAEKLK